MTKSKKLVISDIGEEYQRVFLNLADTLELTRGQLLILLLIGADLVDGGIENVISIRADQQEWRDLMVQRVFDLSRL